MSKKEDSPAAAALTMTKQQLLPAWVFSLLKQALGRLINPCLFVDMHGVCTYCKDRNKTWRRRNPFPAARLWYCRAPHHYERR